MKIYAEKPNEKWCTDFTYIFMEDGRKRYNCSIIDLYDRTVVATLNSSHMDAELAVQTLKIGLERNHPPKLCCIVSKARSILYVHLPISAKKLEYCRA